MSKKDDFDTLATNLIDICQCYKMEWISEADLLFGIVTELEKLEHHYEATQNEQTQKQKVLQ